MRFRANRIRNLLCAVTGVAALALAGRAPAQGAENAALSPVEVVAALHAGIVAAAADPARGVAERYAQLEPVVGRTHDLPYIAELSIRRYWAGLTDEQRQRFVAAFGRLSGMTYAARFGTVTPDTFAILGSEDAGNGRVQVHAAIKRSSAPDVSMDYMLHETDGGWKIINILADQVSDLALKRAEYHRLLSGGSIEDLIAELESQAADLR
jgi:phospholipid transport system substrate-binding protein